MTRDALIERIRVLSDDEIRRVAPYIHADLEALAELEQLREEVEKGRASARDEPLLDDDAVTRRVEDRLSGRA